MHTVSRRQTSFPFIARLLAFGFAMALSFAPLAAEERERPQPKRSASDDALASDPSLWDKMAPFQSVYAWPTPDEVACVVYCYSVPPCIDAHCVGSKCQIHYTNSACDDLDSCTTSDKCSNGTCVGTPVANGSTCDDGNVCTSSDTCSNGTCVGVPVPDGTSCGSTCPIIFQCGNGQCIGFNNFCDDRNACTSDSCDTGTDLCVHSPIGDSTPCSDDNACTLNDRCLSGTCTGAPINCNDGNICTLDSCNPATGLCANSPISCDDGSPCTADSCDSAIGCVHIGLPEEAGPLVSMDQVALQWAPALGASISNTYRGTIPSGGLSGRSPLYDHVCFESADAQMNGPQLSVDVEDPPVGTSFYYLVDGEASSCGEGPLGTATDGTPEMPAAYCPTPP